MTPDHNSILRAVHELRRGGLVAFPTETVYGLGADALNPAAIERVFARKGRPANNPLIVHVTDERMALMLSSEWSERASQLTRAFWPGPLTLVMPKNYRVPTAVTAGGTTVALRSPAHPVAQALLAEFGGPLVGPSANPSGYISPTRADHVRAHFPDLLVLDDGQEQACTVGIESTVLRVDTLEILRPGSVTAADICRVLGVEPLNRPSTVHSSANQQPLEGPGLLAQHYAPTVRAHMLAPNAWRSWSGAFPAAVLCPAEAAAVGQVPTWARIIPMPGGNTPHLYAARLYQALREADECRPAVILIDRPWSEPNPPPPWLAVADRLARATAEP